MMAHQIGSPHRNDQVRPRLAYARDGLIKCQPMSRPATNLRPVMCEPTLEANCKNITLQCSTFPFPITWRISSGNSRRSSVLPRLRLPLKRANTIQITTIRKEDFLDYGTRAHRRAFWEILTRSNDKGPETPLFNCPNCLARYRVRRPGMPEKKVMLTQSYR